MAMSEANGATRARDRICPIGSTCEGTMPIRATLIYNCGANPSSDSFYCARDGMCCPIEWYEEEETLQSIGRDGTIIYINTEDGTLNVE